MSLSRSILRAVRSCFPRVSGDEPVMPRLDEGTDAFSPRERG